MSNVIDEVKNTSFTAEEQALAAELEGKSTAEILEMARKAESGQAPAPVKKEDPKPEVKKADDKAAAEDDDAADEETVFVKKIDLGDGSGVQVFEAPTIEELVDKLVKAQENATRKIREQAAELQARKDKDAKEAADNDYVLAKKLQEKPKETIEQIVADRLEAERKAKAEADAKAEEAGRQQEAASRAFMAEHPEYVANKTNGDRLVKAVKLLEHQYVSEGKKVNFLTLLQEAYKDLSESGLLELKAEEATKEVNDAKEPTGAEPSRIVKAEEVAPTQRRKASGISQRSRVVTPVRNSGPSEEELRTMPLDKLRELADKQLAEANSD